MTRFVQFRDAAGTRTLGRVADDRLEVIAGVNRLTELAARAVAGRPSS